MCKKRLATRCTVCSVYRMNYNANELAEKLRKMEKSDELSYSKKDTVLSARVRLEKLETMYRTAINEVLQDIEAMGVRL